MALSDPAVQKAIDGREVRKVIVREPQAGQRRRLVSLQPATRMGEHEPPPENRGPGHPYWVLIEPADASATPTELVDAVRRRVVDHGWGMGVGLTALPLRERHRPIAAHTSASHGVGLVSIPAVGTLHRRERLRGAAADVVEGLLGEGRGDGVRRGRGARMAARSEDLGSPAAGAEDPENHGSVRFAAHVVRRGTCACCWG